MHFTIRFLISVFLVVLIQFSVTWSRIVDEKCEEYSKMDRQKRDIATLIYNFFNVATPEKVATEPGEFPHMAHLGFGEENDITFACGGILISEEYILTTATCTKIDVLYLHDNRKKRALRLQHKTTEADPEDEDEEDDEEDEKLPNNSTLRWIQLQDNETYSIEKIIIHPNFSYTNLHNDIALVKLDRNVSFSSKVHPACLYNKDIDLTNNTVIATGWGATAFDEDLSDELLKIPLFILTEEECNSNGAIVLYLNGEMDDTQFCVGGRDTSNTLCQGDGGGPLQVKREEHHNMYEIVGLISFGYMCNLLNFPVYATRVISFIPWIESIVWSNEK